MAGEYWVLSLLGQHPHNSDNTHSRGGSEGVYLKPKKKKA